jgi:hypothetical protein
MVDSEAGKPDAKKPAEPDTAADKSAESAQIWQDSKFGLPLVSKAAAARLLDRMRELHRYRRIADDPVCFNTFAVRVRYSLQFRKACSKKAPRICNP